MRCEMLCWDRDRETPRREQRQRRGWREARPAPCSAGITPSVHHSHTPVGPRTSRSEVRDCGGRRANLTLYNKCLNVNQTFYGLIRQKTIFIVQLCVIKIINWKEYISFSVLSAGECHWQAVKTATGYKLILANFIFWENQLLGWSAPRCSECRETSGSMRVNFSVLLKKRGDVSKTIIFLQNAKNILHYL